MREAVDSDEHGLVTPEPSPVGSVTVQLGLGKVFSTSNLCVALEAVFNAP